MIIFKGNVSKKRFLEDMISMHILHYSVLLYNDVILRRQNADILFLPC